VLPHDQAVYVEQAVNEERGVGTDTDHATSSDSKSMRHSGDMVLVRVIAETNRLSGARAKLAASSGGTFVAAHVTAGVGEIASTPGGLQTNSLVRFVKGKITIHAGDTVEWSNNDPEEPHTITFGPEPADMFDPSPNVTQDADGGLSATLTSPSDAVHSGFIEQAFADQPGTPVNTPPNNSIGAPFNATHFRVKFLQPGTYNYICALHDNLGMVGQVIVLP